MKVIAYGVGKEQKEMLTIANRKKHQLTLITDRLNAATAAFAVGKQAVLLNDLADLSPLVLEQLSAAGIRFIISDCALSFREDMFTNAYSIKVALINSGPVNGISATELSRFAAAEAIRILDIWEIQQHDQNQAVR